MAEIDFEASAITLRTRAKGLLAKLAHDLELEARRFEGSVELDGSAWTARLAFPVRDLHVVGSLRGERVERNVLSSADRAEIERRIRDDVLTVDKVEVSLTGTSRAGGEAHVRVGRGEQRVRFSMTTEERRDGELVSHGAVNVSLSTLGIAEIKGPLGAFKVNDSVEV
ncbi:MAG TPA: hypothetical protein VFB62_01555, partial [Polyangiaceae bacterium]|nr:hypothetical protein [Polyangiaceae bacterium]